jgi:hypothetical protein
MHNGGLACPPPMQSDSGATAGVTFDLAATWRALRWMHCLARSARPFG